MENEQFDSLLAHAHFCLSSVSQTCARMTHTSRRPRRPTTGPSSSASRSPCSRRASSGARRPWSAPQGKRRHLPITLYLAIDERQYRATCFHMTGPHLRCDGRGRPSSAVQPPDDATQEGGEPPLCPDRHKPCPKGSNYVPGTEVPGSSSPLSHGPCLASSPCSSGEVPRPVPRARRSSCQEPLQRQTIWPG